MDRTYIHPAQSTTPKGTKAPRGAPLCLLLKLYGQIPYSFAVNVHDLVIAGAPGFNVIE